MPATYSFLEAETLNVPVLEEGGEVADQGGQRGVQVVRYAAHVSETLCYLRIKRCKG